MTMLAGHYGPAYALKAARPDLPLGALCLAAQLPDLLWAAFALAGVERASVDPHPPAGTPAVRLAAAPSSHSLLAVLGWAAAAGAGLWLLPGPAGGRRGAAPAVAGAVVSHWLLDAVQAAALPLGAGRGTVGLGLERRPVAAFLADSLVLLGGLGWYLRTTASDGSAAGTYGPALLGGLQVLLGALAVFGAPPRDVRVMALGGAATTLAGAGAAAWLSRRRAAR
jgi:hypothetical protein